ncbi:hypothetical protein BGX27_000689 [Mortierella sp. AM989]|nr:hypothetical protein BGX27_000689 [Mortierella sp. AM989]
MTSPPPRKSLSKSPPINLSDFVTPAPHANTQRVGKTSITSSDIGVLRLSGQISQNDDRLPKQLPQLQKQRSDSEGSGSGPQSTSLPETPFLDESPANYPVGHPYTQGSASHTASLGPKHNQSIHFHHESQSQSMEALSYVGVESSMPNSEPDTSISHHSSHSTNGSFSVQNTSDESGSSKGNNSFGTNTSSSMNSRSSESQASDMSFANAETSTPRSTPLPNMAVSQKSTPSDSDQNSSSSQLSPGLRVTSQSQRRRQTTLETQSRSSGSSQSKSIPTIPENDVLEACDTQQTEPFGTDPSLEEVEAALFEAEETHQNTTEIYGSESNREDDDEDKKVLPTKGILAGFGIGVPASKTDEISRSPNNTGSLDITGSVVYLSSDDDETSRSAQSNNLDLHISQSLVNIGTSSIFRSRKSSISASVSSSTTVAAVVVQKSHSTLANDANVSSNSSIAREDAPSISKNDSTEEYSVESASNSQGTPKSSTPADPAISTTRQSTSPDRQVSDVPSSPRQVRPQRSPRRTESRPQDLPSSQSSVSPPSSSDTVLMRLRSAASQDAAAERVFSAVPKRRRPNAVEATPLHVISSVGEEGEFWEGSERNVSTPKEHHVRSRSGSQDISSYPEDFPSEQDIEEHLLLGSEDGSASHQEAGPTDPTGSPQRKTRSQSPTLLPRPRTSQTRELRRRSSTQAPSLAMPNRRVLRRLQSTTEALRSYKINESVWARWRTCYYAGIVSSDGTSTGSDQYGIHFLDEDVGFCDSAHMRPMKLRLGAEVLASRTETMDHSAIVGGIHMATDLEQSRVDVQFEDKTEANLSLRQISLTEEMMSKLDKNMNWDQEPARPASEPAPSVAESSASTISRQTSSVSTPSGTPRKGKSKAAHLERGLPGQLTPTRRGRGDMLSRVGLSSPSRRGKALDLFKDHSFVLSLTIIDGSKTLEHEVTSKIKAGGGTILNDFSYALDGQRRVNHQNLFLISFTAVRTPKYLEALAMNIPRLSYRWIECCVENRQLMPYHSYLLPTGFSKELDTVISSTPLNDRGVFDGLEIGICGTSRFRAIWDRAIKGAGAAVVPVTARSGPKSCNYIVFSCPKAHKQFCAANMEVPSLSSEWLIQCLINQRIMAINGHPDYTSFEGTTPALK